MSNSEDGPSGLTFDDDDKIEAMEKRIEQLEKELDEAYAAAETTMSNEEQRKREQLAAYAHEAWSGWMEYLFSKCEKKKDELIIPTWAVQRWTRQRITPYAELPEEEKESDRAEADKMLTIIGSADKADSAAPSLGPPRLYRENAQLRQRVAELFDVVSLGIEGGQEAKVELQAQISAQADLQDEIQVAIADILECQLVGLYDYIKAVEVRVSKLDAYREVDEPTIKLRLDKIQTQIDSLWERTDIYVDLQEKQREQIDAINQRLDEWEEKDKEATEGIMGFIRMETERLDALEEKVERASQAGKAAWMMEQAKKIDALTEAAKVFGQYCEHISTDNPTWTPTIRKHVGILRKALRDMGGE